MKNKSTIIYFCLSLPLALSLLFNFAPSEVVAVPTAQSPEDISIPLGLCKKCHDCEGRLDLSVCYDVCPPCEEPCGLLDCRGVELCKMDVSGDGAVTHLDSLQVLNHISRINLGGEVNLKFDVNGDGNVTPLDAILISNYLGRFNSGVYCEDTTPTPPPTIPPTETTIQRQVLRDCLGNPIPDIDPKFDLNSDGVIENKDIKLVQDVVGNLVSDEALRKKSDINGDGKVDQLDIILISDMFLRENLPEDTGCGCGNPAPSGCDYQCGSTKVDLGCGCGDTRQNLGCGCGNPAPGECGCKECPPEQCLFVMGWADVSGMFGIHGGVFNTLDDLADTLDITRTEPLPSCFANKIEPHCPVLRPQSLAGIRTDLDDSVKYWAGCYFNSETEQEYFEQCSHMLSNAAACERIHSREMNSLLDLFGVPEHLRDQFALPPRPSSVGRWTAEAPYWYFDKDCNSVSSPPNAEICGFAGAAWSPISLILEDESSLEEDMQVVRFNLGNNKGSEYVLWKASEKNPLLVYDPTKKGNIFSAKQLFGNFTFGGRTSDPSDYEKDEIREPWDSGYDALVLLDINKDGKISEEELKNLSLWFDENRNGVSEEGEVRSLDDVGIIAIYYRNYKPVEGSKDLKLEIGYERRVDGKVLQGASIDWFTETFSSMSEANTALGAIFKDRSGTRPMSKDESAVVENTNTQVSDHASAPKGISADNLNNLTGYWVWTIAEENGLNNPGLFVLSENKDNSLQGYSIAEARLSDNPYNIRSGMSAVPGTGKVERKEDKTTIQLTFNNPKDGGESITHGILSNNGTMIEGYSEQSFEVDVKGKKQSAKANYKWIATKVGVPQ